MLFKGNASSATITYGQGSVRSGKGSAGGMFNALFSKALRKVLFYSLQLRRLITQYCKYFYIVVQ